MIYLAAAFLGGLGLGAIFFGGLWLTIKKSVASRTPALWILISFFFRVSITLAGFYFIASGSWQRLVIALPGFIIARFLVFGVTKRIEDTQMRIKEGGHL